MGRSLTGGQSITDGDAKLGPCYGRRRARGPPIGTPDRNRTMSTGSTDLRHDDAAMAPLSFSQEALWFLDQLAGPNGSWNIALNARLSSVHPETLQRSLQALIERHDPLRTAFVEHEGEPRQHVADDATIALPTEDLGQIPAGVREEELARRMHGRALEPFDLRARRWCVRGFIGWPATTTSC